ncbi:bidirectional sugar transporter SWEET16-like, partial [Fagus crenata]
MLYIQIKTANTVAILNVGLLGLVIAITLLAIHEESMQLTFVGILCAGLTIGMYASPLSSM